MDTRTLTERIMTSIDEAEDLIAAEHPGPEVNVSHVERAASITLGTALVAVALSRRPSAGTLTVGLFGAYMAWRGATGHCVLYEALDTGTAEDEEDDRLAAGAHDDTSVEAAVTIGRPPEEVYAFCRALANVPRFMAFIESVQPLDDVRSRWVARTASGQTLSWLAEILEDQPGELFAWRSLPGQPVHHEGAFRFRPAPGGRGTEVRLDVEYHPPGAPLVRAVARLLGSVAEYLAEEDLRRVKQILEAGETATTRGQPQGGPGCAAPART
jgi:uncharacterized membrane protein